VVNLYLLKGTLQSGKDCQKLPNEFISVKIADLLIQHVCWWP